jgi:hypothetical protein
MPKNLPSRQIISIQSYCANLYVTIILVIMIIAIHARPAMFFCGNDAASKQVVGDLLTSLGFDFMKSVMNSIVMFEQLLPER